MYSSKMWCGDEAKSRTANWTLYILASNCIYLMNTTNIYWAIHTQCVRTDWIAGQACYHIRSPRATLTACWTAGQCLLYTYPQRTCTATVFYSPTTTTPRRELGITLFLGHRGLTWRVMIEQAGKDNPSHPSRSNVDRNRSAIGFILYMYMYMRIPTSRKWISGVRKVTLFFSYLQVWFPAEANQNWIRTCTFTYRYMGWMRRRIIYLKALLIYYYHVSTTYACISSSLPLSPSLSSWMCYPSSPLVRTCTCTSIRQLAWVWLGVCPTLEMAFPLWGKGEEVCICTLFHLL